MTQQARESVRPPAVAGRFYPGDAATCRAEAGSFLQVQTRKFDKPLLGAVVPHAGWICSGAIAGEAIKALASQGPVDVVVVFGAVHTPLRIQSAALDSHQKWWLPSGESRVQNDLRKRLQDKGNLFVVDDRLHAQEHAIEVEVPLIQLAWPGVAILPIEIPPIDAAELIGRKTAQCIRESGLKAAYLASTDLTHYGSNYGFTPAGVGPAAMQWTKDNDQRLLDLITALLGDRIVPEVSQRHNACGAGAVAALIGACRELGATRGEVLKHATSYETLQAVQPQPPTQAVGYAAVVLS